MKRRWEVSVLLRFWRRRQDLNLRPSHPYDVGAEPFIRMSKTGCSVHLSYAAPNRLHSTNVKCPRPLRPILALSSCCRRARASSFSSA